MRKITLFLAIVAIALSVFATMVSLQNIHRIKSAPNTDELVKKVTEAVANPVFDTPESVLGYQMGITQKKEADEIFLQMTEKDIYNTYSVVKNTVGSVTKMGLIQEYLKHKTVYDNLPPEEMAKDTANVESEQPAKKDTTATAGKSVKITIE